jgi:hypothetical protein
MLGPRRDAGTMRGTFTRPLEGGLIGGTDFREVTAGLAEEGAH